MSNLSDQLKPRVDLGQRMSLAQEQPPTPALAPAMDDAEAQMRRALGLFGDGPRPRADNERSEQPQRQGGFIQGVHRRRFVQDGEVPVTVVRRDQQDASHPGAGPAGPTSSRLQRVEAGLQAETAARDRAERALHEAQAIVQTLQTKIGHNELTKTEALAASKRDREEVVTLREELATVTEQCQSAEHRVDEIEAELRTLRDELATERRQRRQMERKLEEVAEEPEPVVTPIHAEPRRPDPVRGVTEMAPPARRGRPPLVRPEPVEEPEPVKWWLTPPKGAAKRR